MTSRIGRRQFLMGSAALTAAGRAGRTIFGRFDMTFRIGRGQFLMGSSALIAAGAAGFSPALAQGSPLRMIWWGGQARADRTLAVADAYADAKGITPLEGEFL